MSDITEVPAPYAGLPTARSPGRPPSAEYLKFLDEGGELIDMANFDFRDEALRPAIEVLKSRPFDILAAAIDKSKLAAPEARDASLSRHTLASNLGDTTILIHYLRH